MDEDTYNYITSERFIHDDLVIRCDQLIQELPFLFANNEEELFSYAVVWPAKAYVNDDGKTTDSPVYLPLHEEKRVNWPSLLRQLITKVPCFGIVVLERTGDKVQCRFESRFGCKCWYLHIRQQGDVRVLTKDRSTVNDRATSLGFFWNPDKLN